MADRIYFFPNPSTKTPVLLFDFAGFTVAADSLPYIRQAQDLVAQQPPNSLYCVVDVTGSKFNGDVVDALKELARHNRPYVIASALVGVSGLQRIILDSVLAFTGRENLKSFPTRAAGLAWLADQERSAAA